MFFKDKDNKNVSPEEINMETSQKAPYETVLTPRTPHMLSCAVTERRRTPQTLRATFPQICNFSINIENAQVLLNEVCLISLLK